MPKANRQQNIRCKSGSRNTCAGLTGARAGSAHAVFAEYLLAMRMPGHAEQANAEAVLL